ncbi:MAG: spore maturation protein [Planctomycetota bacterium]
MMEVVRLGMDILSQWTIPLVILAIIITAAVRKVPMYESFVSGAKEGFDVAIMIIPYLVAILFVIKVFTASGIFADIQSGLGFCLASVGLGGLEESLELLPLALTRPLSGGGARGVLLEIFDTHGPDSFIGNTATLMMGSTETTFYVLTVYFGAAQIKKIRHTLPACLIADFAGLTTALVLGYLFFA